MQKTQQTQKAHTHQLKKSQSKKRKKEIKYNFFVLENKVLKKFNTIKKHIKHIPILVKSKKTKYGGEKHKNTQNKKFKRKN